MGRTGAEVAVSRVMLTVADVEAAAARLVGVAHRTPVLTSRTLDERVGASVFVKAECFQRVGAFKFRGAYAKLTSLAPEELARGVFAASSGNHAQAVALSARLLGTTAVILMPDDAPAVKAAATLGYGAELVRYDRYGADRDEIGRALVADRGLTPIPAFDDLQVMAGQGTAALELIEEVGKLDVLVVPVGGGGLIAGCATVAKDGADDVRVIGVEPEAGDDARRSLAAGERVRIPVPKTIADGQQTESVGVLTFEVIRELVDEIVTVTDDEIVSAMAFLFDRMKLVTEPSGASAVAALLTGAVTPGPGARVGIIVSGGNVGVGRFVELIGRRLDFLS